jgi:hypothetical protein
VFETSILSFGMSISHENLAMTRILPEVSPLCLLALFLGYYVAWCSKSVGRDGASAFRRSRYRKAVGFLVFANMPRMTTNVMDFWHV